MPTEDEIKDAYAYARGHAAARSGGRSELAEVTLDAATDGVLWAISHYNPLLGPFAAFARSAIRRCVRWHAARWSARRANRPRTLSLDAGQEDDSPPVWLAVDDQSDRGGPLGLPLSVRELPPDHATAVRFFFLDGYTVRDGAALMGTSPESFRRLLLEAARLLGDGQEQPRRKTGEKRMTH